MTYHVTDCRYIFQLSQFAIIKLLHSKICFSNISILAMERKLSQELYAKMT